MLGRRIAFTHLASTVVHAREQALVDAFLAGQGFFNGLAGEAQARWSADASNSAGVSGLQPAISVTVLDQLRLEMQIARRPPLAAMSAQARSTSTVLSFAAAPTCSAERPLLRP